MNKYQEEIIKQLRELADKLDQQKAFVVSSTITVFHDGRKRIDIEVAE